MAAVNFSDFFATFLPNFLRNMDSLRQEQYESLRQNFKTDTVSCYCNNLIILNWLCCKIPNLDFNTIGVDIDIDTIDVEIDTIHVALTLLTLTLTLLTLALTLLTLNLTIVKLALTLLTLTILALTLTFRIIIRIYIF